MAVSHARRACLKAGLTAGLKTGLATSLALAASRTLAHPEGGDAGPLRIVGPWEITGLEPASSGFLFTRLQVTETLMEADDDGLPLPGLAEQWQASADGLRWRFAVRSRARFHDGSAVTAAQVVAMLRRAAGRPGPLSTAPVASITADGAAVVVQLSAPFAALPAVLSHCSTMVLAASAFDAGGKVVRIIGSGPYKVVNLQPPQRIDISASEHYDGPPPTVHNASYLSVGRAETRALMAEAGQAHIAFGLDPASLAQLRSAGRVKVVAVTIPRTTLLKVNAGHRWLADPRARQALSLALDRPGIARALLRDPGLSATQLFPPTLAEWHVPSLPALHMDAPAARQLWRAMGWQPGADGIFVRGKERLSLTLRTFPDRPELPLLATAIQEQLRQTGVDVTVAIGNSSEIPARHRDGSLELALVARQFGLIPDPTGTLLQDFSPTGGDWGAMHWQHPDLQQALAKLSALPPDATAAVRAHWRGRVADIQHRELPVIPVAWYRQTAAVSPALTGFSLDPLERSYRLTRLQGFNTPLAQP